MRKPSGAVATACRICAVGCGTLVEIDEGRIVHLDAARLV